MVWGGESRAAVDSRDPGRHVFCFSPGYGGLGLSIEGPSKVDINCEDMEDGTCKVTYCPTEPGTYIINIKFADKHVPGEALGCSWVERGWSEPPDPPFLSLQEAPSL